MAEKEQEHLRIRLGARLLKKIDAAREKSGRTRTDEIEARLEESFRRLETQQVASEAAQKGLLIFMDLMMGDRRLTFEEMKERLRQPKEDEE